MTHTEKSFSKTTDSETAAEVDSHFSDNGFRESALYEIGKTIFDNTTKNIFRTSNKTEALIALQLGEVVVDQEAVVNETETMPTSQKRGDQQQQLAISEDEIRKLVDQLQSRSFEQRLGAHKELKKIGDRAVHVLNEIFESPTLEEKLDLEGRRRLKMLIEDSLSKHSNNSIGRWLLGQIDQPDRYVPKIINQLPGMTKEEAEERKRILSTLSQVAKNPKFGLSKEARDEYLKDFFYQIEELSNLDRLRARLDRTTEIVFEGIDLNDDTTLEHLKGFTNLQDLSLMQSKITDGVLAHLKGLPRLRRLNLAVTNIKDASLKHLAGLTNLSELNLKSTLIMDGGLKHIAGLTNLSKLNLSATNITDEGLKHLTGLTNLNYLNLDYTKITDVGLKYLRRLNNLRELSLVRSHITEKAWADLKAALPNCNILGTPRKVSPIH